MLEAPSVPVKGAASFLSAPWLWVRIAVWVVADAELSFRSLVMSYCYGTLNTPHVRAVVIDI